MKPLIETLPAIKLVGVYLTMSISDDRTFTLWHSFMPRLKEISDRATGNLISMRVYNEPMRPGDLSQTFEKWAAVVVNSFNNVPEGMASYSLQNGLYAMFHYKGLNTDSKIFKTIYGTWLPSSGYILDDRPHFELLGNKYKNGNPDSEEEICIPIRMK
jgi:AraC family transcriptional regulator